MWRQFMPYVVLALTGMVSLSLLLMLLSILRAFLLKSTPDRLLRRRRSVYLWAFNSLVLIAALVASGLVMVPQTTRLEILQSRPAAPVPPPAAITPEKLWSRLGGNFIPLPPERGQAPIEPRRVTPSVRPTARPPVKKPPPAAAATGPGRGWIELLAGLTLKPAAPAPAPAPTPFEPPKVVLPSTDPETLQVPPPPAPAAPAAPTAPAPAPAAGPRPSAPTVGPAATPPAAPSTPPQAKPTPRPPAPPPVPPAPPAAAPAPAPVRKRCWALSTDSFRRRDRAIYQRRRRAKLGLVLHPVARVRVRGHWWYRVIVGCFPTRQAAQRYARRLRKKGLTRDVAQALLRPDPRARAGP